MTDLNKLANLIEQGQYEYDLDFIGCVCSCCATEGEDGMFYSVSLSGEDDEDMAYAKHIIKIGEEVVYCHEYQNSSRQWFVNEEEIEYSLLKELHAVFDDIIKPFDFEEYALENFNGDAISESIPYGDPYCLLISNCAFMIEEGGADFQEEDVRNLLKSYNWTEEKIEDSIRQGYDITSDVYDVMCDLPVIYQNDYEE
ncbi:MAG: hypothetical protein HUK18_05305 [Bacteroidales bacterium]|nr:hypothetical protein [Bacteroidales bacterium]